MKLQRCANGHFYDGDKYPTCPHCQDAGLPGFKDDETVTQPLNRAPGAVTSAGGGFGIGEYPTVEEMTAVIAAAPHVRRVDSVQFLCRSGGKLLDYERCADMPFGIPAMGEPQLHIREDR